MTSTKPKQKPGYLSHSVKWLAHGLNNLKIVIRLPAGAKDVSVLQLFKPALRPIQSVSQWKLRRKGLSLAYYAWPRTYPSRSCKRNPWRQHVHRATRRRSHAIDMAWRHVALATTTISAQRVHGVTSHCLYGKKKPTRFKHVTSIICYLCFTQYAWRC